MASGLTFSITSSTQKGCELPTTSVVGVCQNICYDHNIKFIIQFGNASFLHNNHLETGWNYHTGVSSLIGFGTLCSNFLAYIIAFVLDTLCECFLASPSSCHSELINEGMVERAEKTL